MKYINVYMNRTGLWSASLCQDTYEIANIGGSYPKSRSAQLDAILKWGRDFEIKLSYSPMFFTEELKNDIINSLNEGKDTAAVAETFRIKASHVRAIKAHVTRGTYNKYKKELL